MGREGLAIGFLTWQSIRRHWRAVGSPREVEGEGGTGPESAMDIEITAVLPCDFQADRQSQTGSSIPLGRLEQREYFVEFVGRDS